ncbi:Hypothetical predicted protein [Podarcis lilfordi]|uniref:Uncharacterized protein n=1 Tax=Podarcis lilfordi TaxID=74358 RepID=A0AA35LKU1_9SAUR|nr:Hypothetical predicted protein [Podarcis lilfordi]
MAAVLTTFSPFTKSNVCFRPPWRSGLARLTCLRKEGEEADSARDGKREGEERGRRCWWNPAFQPIVAGDLWHEGIDLGLKNIGLVSF